MVLHLFLIKSLSIITARVRGQLVPSMSEQFSAHMKRTSHLQAGLWRVENVPQQLFPDWGFRLIKDSKIVVRREYGPYSTYCVSVEFIDLIFFF